MPKGEMQDPSTEKNMKGTEEYPGAFFLKAMLNCTGSRIILDFGQRAPKGRGLPEATLRESSPDVIRGR